MTFYSNVNEIVVTCGAAPFLKIFVTFVGSGIAKYSLHTYWCLTKPFLLTIYWELVLLNTTQQKGKEEVILQSYLNPLTPMSDQHRITPHIINTISTR